MREGQTAYDIARIGMQEEDSRSLTRFMPGGRTDDERLHLDAVGSDEFDFLAGHAELFGARDVQSAPGGEVRWVDEPGWAGQGECGRGVSLALLRPPRTAEVVANV